MELRNYQQEAIDSIRKYQAKGVNKQVIVLATGLGKTIIFNHLISQLIKETGKKALIIAHREELLEQALEKLEKIDSNLRADIEQAGRHASDKADVVIASVPTLGRKNSTRIQRFDPNDFCIAVTDEAHHSSASTYKEVFRSFGILKNESDWNKDLLLLGVTATPSRNDNQGIDQIYDKVSFEYGIIKGIEDGWLARIKAYRIDTGADLRGVRKTAGDFNLEELANRVNTVDRNGLVVSSYKKFIPDQKALVFAVDVPHTIALHDRFKEEGVPVAYVTGSMSKDERRGNLAKFSTGEIKVMVNCMVLTEGFDEPTIQAVLMARPTQSGILFQQMIGRGTRISPNKDHLTILDFHDNTYRQTLQTTASLLGVEGALDFKGQDILLAKEKIEKLMELDPYHDLDKLDIDQIDYEIEEVDILSGLQIPNEISPYTNYDWHKYTKDTYRINLGNHQWLEISHDIAGQFSVSEYQYLQETNKTNGRILGSRPTLKMAVEDSDLFIHKKYPNRLRLVSNTAGWRTDQPSDAQIELLGKLGIKDQVLHALDKGRASRLITKLLNKKSLNKNFRKMKNPYTGQWYSKKI